MKKVLSVVGAMFLIMANVVIGLSTNLWMVYAMSSWSFFAVSMIATKHAQDDGVDIRDNALFKLVASLIFGVMIVLVTISFTPEQVDLLKERSADLSKGLVMSQLAKSNLSIWLKVLFILLSNTVIYRATDKSIEFIFSMSIKKSYSKKDLKSYVMIQKVFIWTFMMIGVTYGFYMLRPLVFGSTFLVETTNLTTTITSLFRIVKTLPIVVITVYLSTMYSMMNAMLNKPCIWEKIFKAYKTRVVKVLFWTFKI